MDCYVTLGAHDYAIAKTFYDAALAAIGWASHAEFDGWRAYSEGGRGEGFTVWICRPYDGREATAGNGTMLGFMASSQEAVRAFHAAALAHGGSDEGAPGPRPNYGPEWYAAYVRDPSGNKLGVVHRS
jgi:catechol 2,3-dioxygenase-like lactoylglutathione lyase family enzyme